MRKIPEKAEGAPSRGKGYCSRVGAAVLENEPNPRESVNFAFILETPGSQWQLFEKRCVRSADTPLELGHSYPLLGRLRFEE